MEEAAPGIFFGRVSEGGAADGGPYFRPLPVESAEPFFGPVGFAAWALVADVLFGEVFRNFVDSEIAQAPRLVVVLFSGGLAFHEPASVEGEGGAGRADDAVAGFFFVGLVNTEEGVRAGQGVLVLLREGLLVLFIKVSPEGDVRDADRVAEDARVAGCVWEAGEVEEEFMEEVLLPGATLDAGVVRGEARRSGLDVDYLIVLKGGGFFYFSANLAGDCDSDGGGVPLAFLYPVGLVFWVADRRRDEALNFRDPVVGGEDFPVFG